MPRRKIAGPPQEGLVWEAFLRYWHKGGGQISAIGVFGGAHRKNGRVNVGDSNSHRAMAWRAFYAGYMMITTRLRA